MIPSPKPFFRRFLVQLSRADARHRKPVNRLFKQYKCPDLSPCGFLTFLLSVGIELTENQCQSVCVCDMCALLLRPGTTSPLGSGQVPSIQILTLFVHYWWWFASAVSSKHRRSATTVNRSGMYNDAHVICSQPISIYNLKYATGSAQCCYYPSSQPKEGPNCKVNQMFLFRAVSWMLFGRLFHLETKSAGSDSAVKAVTASCC